MSSVRAEETEPAAPAGQEFPAEHLEFFEREVRPLLVRRCQECHGAKKQSGGLRLDSHAGLLKGGESGPAVVPGESAQSLLMEAVRYEGFEMPPTGKLPKTEVATLEKWIGLGAPWPREAAPAAATTAEQKFPWQERLQHWSFQPIQKVKRPQVRQQDWATDPLDDFILTRLEAAKLQPAPDASPRAWLRRVYFDLIGLPPDTPDVEKFLADPSPQAKQEVVERLLDSPQFGERWARHWMDLVRYAESRGHEFDYTAANAYQYRDYLIRAFNADVPYDQFVIEHLAGDLMDPPRVHPEQGWNESILGTGFWFLGEWVHSPVDTRQDEAERFDNMIDVMSKTFLGLTVSCARCHDHKFDAISTQDYYALYGYLQSSTYRQVRFETMEQDWAVATALSNFRTEHEEEVRGALAQSFAQSLLKSPANLSDYLLATYEVLKLAPSYRPAVEPVKVGDKEPPVASQTLTLSMRDRISEVAADKNLDADRLAAWCRYLWQPLENSDPFWAWSQLCTSTTPVLEYRADRARNGLKPARPADLSSLQIIADYRGAAPVDLLQDGYSFGLGPQLPGDLVWGRNSLISGININAAARRDPAWEGLSVTPDTERNPGDMGSFTTPGSTLHTTTFELTDPSLQYLIRGNGTVQVVVDSHRTLNGPLHRRTVLRLPDSPADGPRWITHRLDDYVGHRVHVEFTPPPHGDFAVLAVGMGSGSVSTPVSGVPESLTQSLHGLKNESQLATLAAAYDDWASAAVAQLGNAPASVQRRQNYKIPTELALADWLLNHRDLALGAQQQKELDSQLAPLQSQYLNLVNSIARASHTALAMMDGPGENEHVFIRGNPHNLGPEAPRQLLRGICGEDQEPPSFGSGRLELARRVVDPSNPFVSRVIVNRLWHHLLGRGLVSSVDNFGELGEEPTHPLLLDYLATRFMAEGWSLKQMIRNIVLSRTYAQASTHPDPKAAEIDPQNQLWHQANVRRLTGEAIRDSLLKVSGRLDPKMYGPSVPIYLTPFMEGRGRPRGGPLDGAGRRSVYLSIRRNFLSPMMLAFDMPIPFNSMGKRNVSNVPAQALILLNDPFVVEMAQVWASNLMKQPDDSVADRVQSIYLTALSRPATPAELAAAEEFLAQQSAEHGVGGEQPYPAAAWQDLCHVVFNLREFIFLE